MEVVTVTTLEVTTPTGGSHGQVVTAKPLTSLDNDNLDHLPPPSSLNPQSSRVGVLEEPLSDDTVDTAAPAWPYGTGGRCGPQFAAVQAKMLGDFARLGVRGALEHWTATGWLGPATLEVLTPEDIERMERALGAGEAP